MLTAKNIIAIQKPKVEIPAPKIVTTEPKKILLNRTEQKEQIVEKKEFITAEVSQKQSETYHAPLKKNKTPQFILIIAVVAILAFVSAYFIKAQNHPEKVQPETPIGSQIQNVQPVVKPAPQDATFTTTNITQFLLGCINRTIKEIYQLFCQITTTISINIMMQVP